MDEVTLRALVERYANELATSVQRGFMLEIQLDAARGEVAELRAAAGTNE